jgi:DtxR family Mn-dependent transcriptional regulator
MTNIGTVSPSLEDYVEVIFDLLREKGVARVADVARRKDVKMASVNNAIKRLAKEDLLTQENYKSISLTSKGTKLARQLDKRHSVLKRFLEEIIEINPKIANVDACAIEHHVHKETINGLVKFINTYEEIMPKTKKSLDHVSPGKRCIIKKIRTTGEIKQRLLEMGLGVGEKILVERIAPLGDPINIKIKRYHLSLRKQEAATIDVEEINK